MEFNTMMMDDSEPLVQSKIIVHVQPVTLFDSPIFVRVDRGLPSSATLGQNLEIPSPAFNQIINPIVEPNHLVRCVNCGSDVTHKKKHYLDHAEVKAVIRQWIAPQVIEGQNVICHPCWLVAMKESESETSSEQASASCSSRHSCVNCKTPLLKKRTHKLHSNTEKDLRIKNMISDWIKPQQLRGSDEICHPCWVRSDRAATQTYEPATFIQSTIKLPSITRPPDTQAHCFFPKCSSSERMLVPRWLRLKLFTEYKFYVPTNCRICSVHLNKGNWEPLRNVPQPIHSFTSHHIEDFATFANERKVSLDFSNADGISDELVNYWLGLSKEKFKYVVDELPTLETNNNRQLALAALLMRLRTGDSDERLARMLKLPCATLVRMMKKARKILEN